MPRPTRPHSSCGLLIAGDGQEMANLKQLAADLGVANEVCFAGWVHDTDSFYNALDINTLTSISETFPLRPDRRGTRRAAHREQ
ncbi:MAG: glycosyltransferase [Evtepia sp.]